MSRSAQLCVIVFSCMVFTHGNVANAQRPLREFDPQLTDRFDHVMRWWGVCYGPGYHQCQSPPYYTQQAPLPIRPLPYHGPNRQFDSNELIQDYLPQPSPVDYGDPSSNWVQSADPVQPMEIVQPDRSDSDNSVLLNRPAPAANADVPTEKKQPSNVEEVAPKVRSEEPESSSDLLKNPASKDPYSPETAAVRPATTVPRTAQRIAEPHNAFPRLRR